MNNTDTPGPTVDNPMQREFAALVADIDPEGHMARGGMLALAERIFFAGALVALTMDAHDVGRSDVLAAIEDRIRTMSEEDEHGRREIASRE